MSFAAWSQNLQNAKCSGGTKLWKFFICVEMCLCTAFFDLFEVVWCFKNCCECFGRKNLFVDDLFHWNDAHNFSQTWTCDLIVKQTLINNNRPWKILYVAPIMFSSINRRLFTDILLLFFIKTITNFIRASSSINKNLEPLNRSWTTKTNWKHWSNTLKS